MRKLISLIGITFLFASVGCSGNVTDPQGGEWDFECSGPTAVPTVPTPGSAGCSWSPRVTASPTPPVVTTPPVATPPASPTPSLSPTPTPDPTPTLPAERCAAFPAFPNAACTGPVSPLSELEQCNNIITQNSANIEGCIFEEDLLIRASNVTIRDSLVRGEVYADYVLDWNLSGLKLIDVEINGTGYVSANGDAAIGYDNYTCIRCDVHHTGRGFNFQNNVTIIDSWAHDFTYVNGAHQSAAGSNGGQGNTVRHNNFNCGAQGCSGALVMYGDFHPVNNNLIEYNLFNGGSYCLYAGSTGTASGKPYPHGTNIRVLNNRFGKAHNPQCGFYGPVAAWENNAGNVWSGNAWQDGSGTVNP